MRNAILILFIAGCSSTGNPNASGGDSGTSAPETPGHTDAYYEALFGPHGMPTITPDSLIGLWGGSADGLPQLRMQLSTTTFILAQQCLSGTAGLTASANIDPDHLKLLEKKSSITGPGPAGCGFDVPATLMLRCLSTSSASAQIEAVNGGLKESGCFFLSGTKLELYGGALLHGGKFTKLSD